MASPAFPLFNRNGKWPPFTETGASFGGPFEFATTQVPLTSTVVTATTAHILGIWLHNPTGGVSVTLTIKDGQTTPQPLPYDGQVIPAGTDTSFNVPFGILASGGITVQASAAGLSCQIVFTN